MKQHHKKDRAETTNPSFDLCAGGTAGAGSTTVTFTNHRTSACTITGLGDLLDCGNSFSVPAKANGVNGTVTCNIKSGATAGTYTYSSSCCDQETNPAIIYQ
jgi:hypothetical protein